MRAGLSVAALLLLMASSAPAADVRQAVQALLPATVMVEWSATKRQDGEEHPTELVMASGAIISPDGLVVTFCGSSDPGQYRVYLDGEELPAKLLVDDRRSNLCLLKIDRQELSHLEISEEPLELGQQVVTVAATDATDRLVAQGIIAAKDRQVAGMPAGLLQTDVNVQAMSAGAPLADSEGRLIGVVVARQSSRGHQLSLAAPQRTAIALPEAQPESVAAKVRHSYALQPPSFSGPTFALPAHYISALLEARQGENTIIVHPGLLGVQLLDDKEDRGVEIAQAIGGTPAADAGLQSGDIILQIDGKEVASPRELLRLISLKQAGSKVTVTYQRDGQERSVEVTLVPRSQPERATAEKAEFHLQLLRPDQVIPFKIERAQKTARPGAQVQLAPTERYHLQLKDVTGSLNVEAPTVHVRRADSDQQLEKLTKEVQSLREQVEKLTRQLEQSADEQ